MNLRFLAVAIWLTIALPPAANCDQTINWSSHVPSELIDSTGSVFDTVWTIALGTFGQLGDLFAPDESNTADWLANWVELDTTNYSTIPIPAFASSVVLDGTTDIDRADEQVYMWFYNNQVGDTSSEWALISDPSWTIASAAQLNDGQSAPVSTFEMNTASIVRWGGLNDTPSTGGVRTDGTTPFDLQTHTFAPVVPEPTVPAVLLVSLMAIMARRTRGLGQ